MALVLLLALHAVLSLAGFVYLWRRIGMQQTQIAELKAALDRAVATRGRFQLIEIALPRGVLSSTLQRFVAGVKRLSSPSRPAESTT